jgi:hypothetical protein
MYMNCAVVDIVPHGYNTHSNNDNKIIDVNEWLHVYIVAPRQCSPGHACLLSMPKHGVSANVSSINNRTTIQRKFA